MAPTPAPTTAVVAGVTIAVDATRPEPLFEQLQSQLAGLIETGALLPGDRLPTVRALAAELAIAPHTVARTVKELESAGLVVTRGRSGTIVSSSTYAAEAVLLRLTSAAATAARAGGISEARAVELLREAFRTGDGD